MSYRFGFVFTWRMFVHDDAGHGLDGDHRGARNAEAAALARDRPLGFFTSHIGKPVTEAAPGTPGPYGSGDPSTDLRAALALHRIGELSAAIGLYRAVVAAAPDSFDATHLLGVALHQTGSSEEARALLNRALEMRPGAVDARFNLAKLDQETDRSATAEAGYRAVLDDQPDHVDALVNLAGMLLDRGESKAAADDYRRAIDLDAGHASGLVGLGIALARSGDTAGATDAFKQAATLDPRNAAVWINLGRVAQRRGDAAEARRNFEHAAAAEPDNPLSVAPYGHFLRLRGETECARALYSRSLARRWDANMALLEAFCLPVIQEDEAAIDAVRARLDADLDRLLDPPAGASLALPLNSLPARLNQTLFHLVYHGRDDRALHEKAARVLLAACPALGNERARPSARRRDGRIRLGIASRHLHGHTIGRLFGGLVEQLPKDRFHISLFRFVEQRDPLSGRFDAAADAVHRLPMRLSGAHEAIAAAGLDVLFYPDIGMDPFTWLLAFARLAPLQCVSWGHPVTTGLPHMDLFLSGRDIEPDDGDRLYSERLIRLDTPVPYVDRPDLPQPPPDRRTARAALGLRVHGRLYVCPQSLFKLHPGFDPILGRILAEDPEGEVLLIDGEHAHWADLLRRRFARAFPDTAHRVQFLGRMPHADFVTLLHAADVILDPPRFSGGKSSLETFAAGRAVVTWPGPLLRDRLTHGFYRMMGIDAATVEDADAYATRALALATDADRRTALEADISRRSSVLFENRGWVDGVADLWGGRLRIR